MGLRGAFRSVRISRRDPLHPSNIGNLKANPELLSFIRQKSHEAQTGVIPLVAYRRKRRAKRRRKSKRKKHTPKRKRTLKRKTKF